MGGGSTIGTCTVTDDGSCVDITFRNVDTKIPCRHDFLLVEQLDQFSVARLSIAVLVGHRVRVDMIFCWLNN